MTTWHSTDGPTDRPSDGPTTERGLVEIAEPPEGAIQIQLEEAGRHSLKGALVGAVISAAGFGPVFRFVAAASGRGHEETDHAGVSADFPLPFLMELDDDKPDDTWVRLAHQRLDELDAELVRIGWRRLQDRGPHWWSLRYEW